MAVFSVDSDAVLTSTAAMRGTIERLQAETSTMLTQLTQLQASWSSGAEPSAPWTTRWRPSAPRWGRRATSTPRPSS